MSPIVHAVEKESSRSLAFHRNATFAALLLGYAGYYLCRQNLSAAMPVLKSSGTFDASQLGWVATIGTLFYALGKVTTGTLADAKGGKVAFFAGIAGTVLVSLALGAAPASFATLVVLWSANSFFQSMGWGGIVDVLSRWFPKRQYGTAMGVMSLSYQAGAAASLAFAAQLLALGFGWRALFVIPAVTLVAVAAAVHPFLKGRPEDVGGESTTAEEVALDDRDEPTTTAGRFRALLSDRGFLVMCGLSFVLTLLRRCFETWLPTYFQDLGAAGAASVIKSTAFPILGCAGTLAAGWFSDRWLGGRRAPVMACFLVVSAVALAGLARLDVLAALLAVERTNVACALVGVLGFFLLGAYSLVGGVAALDFGARRTAGTAAGLLDGVGYLGAALAGIGVAETVKGLGWGGAYGIMAVLAALGVAICGALWNVKPR